ncbi:MAG: hypothetical protein H7311_04470 [Ramlibacter sp.]|nr:hypothetical protein [Cryobacterium sp.]
MRTVTRALLTLSALVLLGGPALTGCAPTPAPKPAATAATDAPVFASDAGALAAATEAYAAYLAAGDSGGNKDDYLALSTGRAHDQDVTASATFEDRGWKQTGVTSFDSFAIQSSTLSADDQWEIRAYLCLDVTKSDVVDSSGVSVAAVDRPLRLPLEVAFVTSSPSENLLIAESRVWSGSNFC